MAANWPRGADFAVCRLTKGQEPEVIEGVVGLEGGRKRVQELRDAGDTTNLAVLPVDRQKRPLLPPGTRATQ